VNAIDASAQNMDGAQLGMSKRVVEGGCDVDYYFNNHNTITYTSANGYIVDSYSETSAD
jgi:hypothetical protein